MSAPLSVSMPALTLDRIRFEIGGSTILHDFTLSIARGEIVCLLGPSGCGKTTALRIAAGLERPTSGAVRLADREVAGTGVFIEPDKRGVGLMFQDYALFPHLTVLRNVMFGIAALPEAQAREAARQALARVGLSAHINDYPHMLSGGEQQRVALARALVPNPSVLLMDEPFSNLDQRMRESIREETVGLLREQNATAVIVTHDPIEAMDVADRIALMRSGILEQVGAPMDLYLHPKTLYAARFLCDTNEIEGYCRGGHAKCPLGTFPALGLTDGPIVVCVRPQSFSIVPPGEGIDARIGGVRYLGDRIRVTVSLDGLSRLLHLTIPACTTDLPEAGRIGLSVDESAVLVFPATGGGNATTGGS